MRWSPGEGSTSQVGQMLAIQGENQTGHRGPRPWSREWAAHESAYVDGPNLCAPIMNVTSDWDEGPSHSTFVLSFPFQVEG